MKSDELSPQLEVEGSGPVEAASADRGPVAGEAWPEPLPVPGSWPSVADFRRTFSSDPGLSEFGEEIHERLHPNGRVVPSIRITV